MIFGGELDRNSNKTWKKLSETWKTRRKEALRVNQITEGRETKGEKWSDRVKLDYTPKKKQKKNEMEKEKTRFTKERKEAAKNTEGSNAVNNHRD